MLHGIGLKLVTDVSGQLIGPILKDQAAYDGKDVLSQTSVKNHKLQHPEQGRPQQT
jgi:hypothetical protein